MLVWSRLMVLGALICFGLAGALGVAAVETFEVANKDLPACGKISDATSPEDIERLTAQCTRGQEKQLVGYYAGGAGMACAVLGVMLLMFARHFRKQLLAELSHKRASKHRF